MKANLVRAEVLKYTGEQVDYREENGIRIVTLKSGKELILAPKESVVLAVKRALSENGQNQRF